MVSGLFDVGMCKGQQYEVILTTWNKDGSRNAAPFGTIVKGNNEIINRIFEGSRTLKNIKREGEFTVNLTYNPLYFSYSLIDNINDEYYVNSDSLVLNDVECFFNAKVTEIKSVLKSDDPIKPVETDYIKSYVSEVVVNKVNMYPLNRGIHCVIESLVNYSRVDIVSSEIRDYYMGRFRENYRVAKKVGSKEDKMAMEYIISNLEKNGYVL